MWNTERMNWSIIKQKFLHKPKMLVIRNYGSSENLGGRNGNHERSQIEKLSGGKANKFCWWNNNKLISEL